MFPDRQMWEQSVCLPLLKNKNVRPFQHYFCVFSDQQGSGPQHFHHSQLAAARGPGSPGGGSGGHYALPAPASPSPYGSAQEVAIYTKPKRSPSGENLATPGGKPSLELSTFQGSTEHLRSKKLVYQPDVVAIQVNKTMVLSSLS